MRDWIELIVSLVIYLAVALFASSVVLHIASCEREKELETTPPLRDVMENAPPPASASEAAKLQIQLDSARAEIGRLEQDLRGKLEREADHQKAVDSGIKRMSWFSMAALAAGLVIGFIGTWGKAVPFFIVGAAAAFLPRIIDDPIVHYACVGACLILLAYVGGMVWMRFRVKQHVGVLVEKRNEALADGDGARVVKHEYGLTALKRAISPRFNAKLEAPK